MTTVVIDAPADGSDVVALINAALADPNVTTVQLGAGIFNISTGIIVPSGKTLSGAGSEGTVIKATGDFQPHSVTMNGLVNSEVGATDVRLEGFSVDVNRALPDGIRINGTFMIQATDFVVKDVDVYNATGYAHFAQGDLGAGTARASGTYEDCGSYNAQVHFEQMRADGVTLINCDARDGDGDIAAEAYFHPLLGSKNITYIDCTAYGEGLQGFSLVSIGEPLENISIIDCDIEIVRPDSGSAIIGAAYLPIENLQISGSRLVSHGYASVRLGGTDGTITDTEMVGGVIGIVVGNSGDGTGSNLLVTDSHALGLRPPTSAGAAFGLINSGSVVDWNGGIIEARGAPFLMFPISNTAPGVVETDGAVLLADGYTVARPYELYDPATTLRGNSDEDDSLSGHISDDTLFGYGGDDALSGGDGYDQLNGGAGGDQMAGGIGNDIYYVDDSGDVVVEAADEGTDTVRSYASSHTLADNVETLVFWGWAGGFAGTGNGLVNAIYGHVGDDVLAGLGGNDMLVGGRGNDTLDGGADDDVMTGGLGDDIYVVDSLGDTYAELAGEGTDTIRTSLATFTLGANFENLTYIGAGGATLTGNNADNVIRLGDGGGSITSGVGNDTLIGGAGVDTLQGGVGGDTYEVGAGDVVTELAGEGTDHVRTSLTAYALGANLEQLTYTGAAAAVLTGNELGNVIRLGNGGGSIAAGASGDVLYGGNGLDTLDGGTGADVMFGGRGNDIYYVDDSADQIVELATGASDRVRVTATSYTLPDHVENMINWGVVGAFAGTGNGLNNQLQGAGSADTLRGLDGDDNLLGYGGDDILEGGAGTDVLEGSTGNDILDGGAGDDVLRGGAGNDTYRVDSGADSVVETAGAGTDLVETSLAAYTIGTNVENLTYTGAAVAVLTGNELANVLRLGTGGGQAFGAAGDDALYGGAGADELDGGTGNDVMSGGIGDDTYQVDSAGDQVVEAAGDGVDLVRTALTSYALGANVDNLTFTGTIAATLTGNDLANVLRLANGGGTLNGGGGADTLHGGTGFDTLNGGAGDDMMVGGASNDIYYVDSAGDQIVETAGGGYDTVRATTSSYTLTSELENLSYWGATGAFTGTGNSLANQIQGRTGADTLFGLGGNDSLYGYDGNDILDGGADNDLLNGGTGTDVLDGGAGRDTLTGGIGADTFRFSSAAHSALGNADAVTDFVAGQDRIDLAAIDANETAAGDQAFSFVGANAFTGTAAELRYDASGSRYDVYGDVNGDGIADLHIVLTVTGAAPTAGDFIL